MGFEFLAEQKLSTTAVEALIAKLRVTVGMLVIAHENKG